MWLESRRDIVRPSHVCILRCGVTWLAVGVESEFDSAPDSSGSYRPLRSTPAMVRDRGCAAEDGLGA